MNLLFGISGGGKKTWDIHEFTLRNGKLGKTGRWKTGTSMNLLFGMENWGKLGWGKLGHP